jgi:CheY-like chemotaxis protein
MPPAKTVVLIDDDHDDHEIFSIALQQSAPSVKCFYFDSGKEALNKFLNDEKFIPDYIFLDLNMPGMSGMQFLETIKKQEPISKIPIIVYTTSIMPREKERVLQLGASDFFIKPTSHLELIEMLKKFFKE